jgi:hypothetical protein
MACASLARQPHGVSVAAVGEAPRLPSYLPLAWSVARGPPEIRVAQVASHHYIPAKLPSRATGPGFSHGRPSIILLLLQLNSLLPISSASP